ncbi:MAG: ABC transporter, partial [Thiomonas sp. 20-64-5]
QDPGHQRLVGAFLETLTEHVVVFCAHDMNWVARHATHVLGLGPLADDRGWFVAPSDAALQPERLRRLYDCQWTRLQDADGHRAWIAL